MTDLQATATGVPPYPVQPKLDVPEAARTTWRVFKRQGWFFIAFLLLPIAVSFAAQIVQLVIQIPVTLMTGKNSGIAVAVVVLLSLLVLIVQICAQVTIQMAALWGAARNVEGGRFVFGDALRVGFERVLPGVGVVLLLLLIIGIGYILLIIPGIIAAGFLALAPAACVIERRGPIESMKRSFALVTDNWWRCFGTLILTLALPILAFAAAVLVVFLLFKAIGIPALALIMILPAIPFFFVLGAVGLIVPAVLFVELRALKEGRGAGTVAGVFE